MGEQTTGSSALPEQHGGFFGRGEPNTALPGILPETAI